MNALQIIETARDHWDEDTAGEHGFEVLPGDAVLHHGASEDTTGQYRIVQFLDIIEPVDTPDATRGLVVEYLVTETAAGATYKIVSEAGSGSIAPTEMNFVLSRNHPKHIYDVERFKPEQFKIVCP